MGAALVHPWRPAGPLLRVGGWDKKYELFSRSKQEIWWVFLEFTSLARMPRTYALQVKLRQRRPVSITLKTCDNMPQSITLHTCGNMKQSLTLYNFGHMSQSITCKIA